MESKEKSQFSNQPLSKEQIAELKRRLKSRKHDLSPGQPWRDSLTEIRRKVSDTKTFK